jgi:hypothetical protein
VTELALPLRAVGGRIWSALLAAWGALLGLAPHVLHHVGPLAGAAVVAGAGGTLLFAALGFVVAIPFLLRLRRRFGTWRAPTAALVLMTVMFSVSAFVVGPAVTSAGDGPPPAESPQGHEQHHG